MSVRYDEQYDYETTFSSVCVVLVGVKHLVFFKNFISFTQRYIILGNRFSPINVPAALFEHQRGHPKKCLAAAVESLRVYINGLSLLHVIALEKGIYLFIFCLKREKQFFDCFPCVIFLSTIVCTHTQTLSLSLE